MALILQVMQYYNVVLKYTSVFDIEADGKLNEFKKTSGVLITKLYFNYYCC